MDTSGSKIEHAATGILRTGTGLAKIIGIALLVYLTGMAVFAITKFSTTKSTLLSYGLSDATSTLLAWAVMFIAIGIPGLAIARLLFFRGKAGHPADSANSLLRSADRRTKSLGEQERTGLL